MKSDSKKRLIFLAIAALLAYFTCVVLELRSVGSAIASGICSTGGTFDCEKVSNSKFSEILGISLSEWGFFFYAFFILGIVHSLVKPKLQKGETGLLFVLSSVSVIFSVYLFIVSKFVIKAICPFCLVLYAINLLLLVLTFKYKVNIKNILNGRLPYFAFVNVSKLFIAFCAALLTTGLIAPNGLERNQTSLVEAWPKTGSLDLEYNFDHPIKGDYYLGNKAAKIQIVEFSDIQCPFCRRVSLIFDDLLKKYPNDLLFIFKNFPLDKSCNSDIKSEMHKYACFAAEAARCAGEQGSFWSYLQDLYTLEIMENESLNEKTVKAAVKERAKILNLDQQAFNDCLESGRQQKAILKDLDEGREMKLKGTPSIWINGKLLVEPSEEVLTKIVTSLVSLQSSDTIQKQIGNN